MPIITKLVRVLTYSEKIIPLIHMTPKLLGLEILNFSHTICNFKMKTSMSSLISCSKLKVNLGKFKKL